MNVIGISAFYHDSACCLLSDGRLVAAASEERFTRIKQDARLPSNAFRYCLAEAGLIPSEIDCLAYYESPIKKSARQLASRPLFDRASQWLALNPKRPARQIREYLGYDGPIQYYDHHISHAASAYYFSGFDHCALLSVDGVGEWATTAYGKGSEGVVTLFETVDFPHSLGLLYATITAFLGFRVNRGEYKVMGLAAYGQPVYLDRLQQLVEVRGKGQYRLQMEFFDFIRGHTMFSPELENLLQMKPRQPEGAILPEHANLASSVQVLLEELVLEKLAYLHQSTGMDQLAMAGGVALNAVANRRIRKESRFKRVFFQPVAGDAGGALGAAALAHQELQAMQTPAIEPLSSLYLGPLFKSSEIRSMVSATGVAFADYADNEEGLIQELVERLLAQQVIGWFHGRMEFGPRALGARSILANPLAPQMKPRINVVIKKREEFRPFAPVVLWSEHTDFFDIREPIPFMNETCEVLSDSALPAVTHVDRSARPQTLRLQENPRLARLLQAFFERTGCPALVNTSFNQQGEPIVCTPVDALICMARSSLNALVLEDILIDKASLPPNLPELLEDWGGSPGEYTRETARSAVDNLYSFT